MVDRFFANETVQCPYDYYDELRDAAPVYKLEDEDVFLVTKYDDCVSVLMDTRHFSNKAGPGLRQTELMAPPTGQTSKYRVVRTLLTNDAPSHLRFRRLVFKAFSPTRVEELEPKIREITQTLIDAFPADGRIDFVRDFAQPLPLMVIADFLGVPRKDLDQFRIWSEDAAEVLGGQLTVERSQECYDSLGELLEYFAEQLELRRQSPADDFLTDLAEAKLEGETPLSTEEILSIAYVTLVAGNETTANMLSAMMRLLLENPEQLARVREDRALIPYAVEEALRLEAPVQGSVRRVREDTTFEGCPMPAGSRVLIVTGAANRDPDVFPQPDQFDLGRPDPRAHVTFGKGSHFCLGAALSRAEGAIALEMLLDRFPQFELGSDFEERYADNAVLRSLLALPMQVMR